MMTAGSFLYCACQASAEAALKLAVTQEHPSLRPAFGRPGLVTFKAPSPLPGPLLRVACPLSRVWGVSLGPARGVDELLAALTGPAATAAFGVLAAAAREPLRLHVWERDRWQPGHEPLGFAYGPAAAIVRAEIEAAWPASARPRAEGEPAEVGDLVLDVILGEEGEPWLVGLRRRRPDEVPFPGGRIFVPTPEHVPSRAYFKLEEALVWSRAPVRAGDVAVELGSAPGGASWALLRRGVEVHGIDNAEMDPRVLEYRGPAGNRFTHHRCLMGQVQRHDLPRSLHWVLCDVNLAPQVAFQTIRRMVARPRRALCGVLLTLKLDTWKAMRHLPRWRTQLDAMGMVEVRITQLPSNRLELFAFGLTAAGAARRSTAEAALGSTPRSEPTLR
jgi:23S rRNA (cytidine2498-2'-O)-methyltransferase